TYALLLSRAKLKEYDLSKLRYITQAGGAMAPASIKRFIEEVPGVEFYVMYGQTEGTARLSYLPPEDLIDKMGSIGKAVPGVTLEIRDKNDEICRPGVTGEICAKGENIMIGYWNAPDATNKAIKDGWLRTGDLAHYDEDGYLYVDGRFTEMIKVGANRISPKEIEEKIAELNGIEELAAVGVPDEVMGQVIKVFIVKKEDSGITRQIIMKHCKDKMAPYKMPKQIEFVEYLPKTASGKLQRFKLLNN
ncbi:MAG: long-chain fatty acid--CoA ligase, partial [Gammaproteobacteria bacterium]|nr:long-chain fatty acid--CoA ligase [Gammaproteobacteria bacterium]